MYVHVYKKTRREPLGVCAHFCPFCRCVTAFRAAGIETVTTVNGIPIGKATRVHDELACRACATAIAFPTGQARPIASLPEGADGRVEMLAELAERTSPWDMGALMSRLDLEARLRSGSITSAERKWLIGEAFDAVEYSATLGLPGAAAPEGGTAGSISRKAWWLIAGFTIGTVGSTVLWAVNIAPGGASIWMWVGMLAASVATGAMLPMLIVESVRYGRELKRRLVLDPLARALGPLGVTEAEVREEYAARKSAKARATKRVKEREVVEAVVGSSRESR